MIESLTEMLSKKGELTIVEHPAGKTIVAIKARGSVLTLTTKANISRNGLKDELLAELLQLCKNWPDINENSKSNRIRP